MFIDKWYSRRSMYFLHFLIQNLFTLYHEAIVSIQYFCYIFFGNWENLHCCCIISDDYLMRSKQKTNCKTTMFNGPETVSNVRKNSSPAEIIFSHHAKQHHSMQWFHYTMSSYKTIELEYRKYRKWMVMESRRLVVYY